MVLNLSTYVSIITQEAFGTITNGQKVQPTSNFRFLQNIVPYSSDIATRKIEILNSHSNTLFLSLVLPIHHICALTKVIQNNFHDSDDN